MAEIKMTEVQAIRNALAGILDEETVAKLNHMIEVRSRKRDRKPDDSKRLANIALGEEFAKACAVCKVMGWNEVPTTEKVKVYTL